MNCPFAFAALIVSLGLPGVAGCTARAPSPPGGSATAPGVRPLASGTSGVASLGSDPAAARALLERAERAEDANDARGAEDLFRKARVMLERQSGVKARRIELAADGEAHFSPDARHVAVPAVALPARDPLVALFEQRGARFALVGALGAAVRAQEIAFAPSPEIAVWSIARGQGGLVHDLDTGATRSLPAARAVTFSPDGAMVVIFADQRVRLLEARTGKTLAEAPPIASDASFRLRFSGDGRRLYVSAADEGGLFVHEIPSLATTIAAPRAFSATLSAGEHFVGAVIADPPALAVFDVISGKTRSSVPLAGFPIEVPALAFAGDESKLVMSVSDDGLSILDVTTGNLTDLSRKSGAPQHVVKLALTADDKRACALTSRTEPALCIFDLARKTGLPAPRPRRPGTIPLDFIEGDRAVSVDVPRLGAAGITSAKRAILASGRGGGADLRNGALAPDRATIAIVEAAARPDAPPSDVYHDVELLLLDAASGRVVRAAKLTPEAREVANLGLWFAPDGRSVAIVLGATGYLVETATGHVLANPSGMDPSSGPVFSADGALLASGGAITSTRTGVTMPLPLSPVAACSVGEHVLPLGACDDRPAGSP